LISGMLFALEEEFEFGEKVVAKGMEARQGVGCLGSAGFCIEGENVCAKGVEIQVPRLDLAEDGRPVFQGETFRRHPRTKTTLRRIERRRHAALAMQKGFDSTDPCGVFCAGIEERPVSGVKRSQASPSMPSTMVRSSGSSSMSRTKV
jgi:hypothetical protein